jgi:hypothetical protein
MFKKLLPIVAALVLAATVQPAHAQTTTGRFGRILLNSACVMRTGSGTPEGAVTGNVCDLYLRTNGGSGSTLYIKESGSGNTGWTAMVTDGAGVGGSAPTTATYITQTSDGTLSAEQALASLSTGIMKVTTTTGVVSSLAIPLTMANGGTDVASASDDQVLVNSGSAWVAKTVPDCTDTGGNHLNYTQSTNAISCGTSGSGGGGGGGWAFVTSSATGTNQNVDFTGLSTYKEILIYCDQCVSSTTAVIQVQVSTDNGGTFLSSSGDYKSIDGSSFAGANDTSMSSSNNGSGTRYTARVIQAFNETKPHLSWLFTTVGANASYVIPTTTALNAVRIRVHTGTFSSGTVYVYGKT